MYCCITVSIFTTNHYFIISWLRSINRNPNMSIGCILYVSHDVSIGLLPLMLQSGSSGTLHVGFKQGEIQYFPLFQLSAFSQRCVMSVSILTREEAHTILLDNQSEDSSLSISVKYLYSARAMFNASFSTASFLLFLYSSLSSLSAGQGQMKMDGLYLWQAFLLYWNKYNGNSRCIKMNYSVYA